MGSARPRFTFDLCGGHLALDLANTVASRQTTNPIDHLLDYDDLVELARQSGVTSPARAARWRAWAKRKPAAAAAVHRRAVALREALYRVFAGVARDRRPDPDDLRIINRELLRLRLDRRFAWTWHAGETAPDALLGTFVLAAVTLLASARCSQVRICDADDCVWVFLDSSKNGSRRWCDMKQCGNRQKARRYYRHHRRDHK